MSELWKSEPGTDKLFLKKKKNGTGLRCVKTIGPPPLLFFQKQFLGLDDANMDKVREIYSSSFLPLTSH